jgi:hypothetical protein
MENIKEFFIKYEAAFNAPDLQAIAASYADEFIMTGPGTSSCLRNDPRFMAALKQANEFYQRIGMNNARILSYAENKLDLTHTLVEVEWALFRDDGTELAAFDVTYLIRSFGRSPKIILFIAHNEQERLRDKGLMQKSVEA